MASGTINPVSFATAGWAGSAGGNNMPDGLWHYSGDNGATMEIIFQTIPLPVGEGLTSLTWHANYGLNPGVSANWYGRLGSGSILALLAGSPNAGWNGTFNQRDAGLSFSYNFGVPLRSYEIPDIRMAAQNTNGGDFAYWAYATIDWTSAIIPRRARMII